MRCVVLHYPHHLPSREPRRLRTVEVWRVGEEARTRICANPRRPKVEIAQLIARAGRLAVNGLAFDTHWECGQAVADEAGCPVLGATEHDPSVPDAVMIYVNAHEIGDRDDLARSTALHELGHAVFDAPSWIERARTKGRSAAGPTRRLLVDAGTDVSPDPTAIDWREWRANEFMGAFLVPRGLLHKHLVRQAGELGLPLTGSATPADGLPVVNGSRLGFERLETLAIELAETFGVSIAFMLVRLRKYGLVRGA